MITIDAFNTRTYSADTGSGWEAYATEGATELLAGANFMNSVFTTIQNVTFNLEAMDKALDANVADGTMTQAEADTLNDELQGELLDNFANKYNGELGLIGTGNEVEFASIEDVFSATLDLMTPGMNSLTGFMQEVTQAIPPLQSADETTELINTIQFVGAVLVGVGVGINGFIGAGRQLTGTAALSGDTTLSAGDYLSNGASVLIAAGVNLGTYISFGVDDIAEFEKSDGIAQLEDGLNETWQDLVDAAGSGSAFEAASLGYAEAYRGYSDVIVEFWPDGYSLAGEQAFNTSTGTELFRTFEGGLNDADSFNEVTAMIDALKGRAAEINEQSESEGLNIRYEVIHSEPFNPTDFITGDPGDQSQPYYEEGSFVSVRVIRDPVVEAGGTRDPLFDFDVSMNIDNY